MGLFTQSVALREVLFDNNRALIHSATNTVSDFRRTITHSLLAANRSPESGRVQSHMGVLGLLGLRQRVHGNCGRHLLLWIGPCDVGDVASAVPDSWLRVGSNSIRRQRLSAAVAARPVGV